MRLFFLSLAFSLVLAGLAIARDSRFTDALLLADSNSTRPGPPPGWGDSNSTRPGPPPGWDDSNSTRPGPPPGGNSNSTRPQGPGGPPPGGGDANATRPQGPGGGQGRPSGPPPGFPPHGSGGFGGPGGPGGPGGGPGAAFAAACSGKSAGDDCTVTDPRGNQIAGQCVQSPRGGSLECRPQRK